MPTDAIKRCATLLNSRLGEGTSVSALLACEMDGRALAVACIAGGADAASWQLIDAASGEHIDDNDLLGDALVLVATIETMLGDLEAADVARARARVREWRSTGDEDAPTRLLDDALGSLAEAIGVLEQIHAVRADASTPLLDRLGAALLDIERRLSSVELLAEQWTRGREDAGDDAVQSLWIVLASVRRTLVPTPVTVRIEQGRDAGTQLANDALGATS